MGRLGELLRELWRLSRRPEQVPPDCERGQVLPSWEPWSAEQERQRERQRKLELEIEIE